MADSKSLYEDLPLAPNPNSFRLLQILPEDDPCSKSQPRCRLFAYSPSTPTGDDSSPEDSIPQYQALSYVWGAPDKTKSIAVNDKTVQVTENLYAALVQLRCWAVDFIWIDAICINQGDVRERGHQVRTMANIYSRASRVIIWLGQERPDSTKTAFNAIREQKSKLDENSKWAVLELLKSRWFRRIWVRPRQLDPSCELFD